MNSYISLSDKAIKVLISCLSSKETEIRCMGASGVWALLHNNQRVQTDTHIISIYCVEEVFFKLAFQDYWWLVFNSQLFQKFIWSPAKSTRLFLICISVFSLKGQDCSEVPLRSIKDRGGTYHLQEGCVFIHEWNAGHHRAQLCTKRSNFLFRVPVVSNFSNTNDRCGEEAGSQHRLPVKVPWKPVSAAKQLTVCTYMFCSLFYTCLIWNHFGIKVQCADRVHCLVWFHSNFTGFNPTHSLTIECSCVSQGHSCGCGRADSC